MGLPLRKMILILILFYFDFCFGVDLWKSSGGYLSHDPHLKLTGTNFESQEEAYCYLEKTNQIESDSNLHQILCFSDFQKELNKQPSQEFLEQYETAGGQIGSFWNSRWSGWRIRVTEKARPIQCVKDGDSICKSEFGENFKILADNSSMTNGFWAFCGANPLPKNALAFGYSFSESNNNNIECTKDQHDGKNNEITPIDECWNFNPCPDPLDCVENNYFDNKSAFCETANVPSNRGTLLARCARILNSDICLDLYIDPGNEQDNVEQACAFGTTISRNGQTIFDQHLNITKQSIACQPTTLAGVSCDSCVVLTNITTATNERQASACVEFEFYCQNTPVIKSRLGCATSPAIAHCEDVLAERPPPLPTIENGTETRCARLGPLSPIVCLDIKTDDCNLNIGLKSAGNSIIERSFDIADIVDIDSTTNAANKILTPRRICVENDLSPCSTCIDWTENPNLTPRTDNLPVLGACASVNVTCLNEEIAIVDLGCFEDREIAAQCIEPCTSSSCLNGGTCNNGICECVAPYHGARCSFQCPNNCSNFNATLGNKERGLCLSEGVCSCLPPNTGLDCSEDLFSFSFTTIPRQTRTKDGVDVNGRGYAPKTLTSCPEDCSRQGDCVEKKCICYSGFEGDTCASVKAAAGLTGITIFFIILLVFVILMVIALLVYVMHTNSIG